MSTILSSNLLRDTLTQFHWDSDVFYCRRYSLTATAIARTLQYPLNSPPQRLCLTPPVYLTRKSAPSSRRNATILHPTDAAPNDALRRRWRHRTRRSITNFMHRIPSGTGNVRARPSNSTSSGCRYRKEEHGWESGGSRSIKRCGL